MSYWVVVSTEPGFLASPAYVRNVTKALAGKGLDGGGYTLDLKLAQVFEHAATARSVASKLYRCSAHQESGPMPTKRTGYPVTKRVRTAPKKKAVTTTPESSVRMKSVPMKKFSITFDVTLHEDEIWPDLNGPVDPTKDDVLEVILNEKDFLHDWNMMQEIEVKEVIQKAGK